jgi:hypothetical protein
MKKRSIIALCSGILEMIFVFPALMMGFNEMGVVWGTNIFWSYMYFTMISNTMAAISVAFVIPFAVEGIRKKRFILPGWIAVLLFISTTSETTICIILTVLMKYIPHERIFGHGGIYAHFICPILVFILFFQIESGYQYKRNDRILACLPFFIYIILYYVMVVIIGKENGGWDDIYNIMGIMTPFAAILFCVIAVYTVSLIIAKISNYLGKKRTEKKFRFWTSDVKPMEARIEAYGLGIMMAHGMDKNNIEIPYDILEELEKRYDIEPSDMINLFIKGLQEGMR